MSFGYEASNVITKELAENVRVALEGYVNSCDIKQKNSFFSVISKSMTGGEFERKEKENISKTPQILAKISSFVGFGIFCLTIAKAGTDDLQPYVDENSMLINSALWGTGLAATILAVGLQSLSEKHSANPNLIESFPNSIQRILKGRDIEKMLNSTNETYEVLKDLDNKDYDSIIRIITNKQLFSNQIHANKPIKENNLYSPRKSF